jgi:hypothetical protein
MKQKDIDTQAFHCSGHKHVIDIEHYINSCVTFSNAKYKFMGLKRKVYID